MNTRFDVYEYPELAYEYTILEIKQRLENLPVYTVKKPEGDSAGHLHVPGLEFDGRDGDVLREARGERRVFTGDVRTNDSVHLVVGFPDGVRNSLLVA